MCSFNSVARACLHELTHSTGEKKMKIRHGILTQQLALVLAVLASASTVGAAPKDKTPPTTPTNLQVTGTSDYSVSLTWSPSTDNSGFWYYKVVSSAGITVLVD